VLAELELKLNPSLGHKHLTNLAEETRSHDLELLAHEAENAIASSPVVAQSRSVH
jgi:hypothetical protein